MHITGGSYRGDGWWHHPKNFTQQGLDELVEESKKIAPYAEDAGVAICPETTQWCILNSLERMKEYVDRVDSDYVMVTYDVVNHMRPDRIYESGRFFRCAVTTLGDRIGMLHVKDVQPVAGLVVHIDEAPMGTGILDHAEVIRASNDLEPWKLFSLEHFNEKGVPIYEQWMKAYKHIMTVSGKIENQFTEPQCTRERWKQGRCK
jgi:sugar phosphate isomerase/epimerase